MSNTLPWRLSRYSSEDFGALQCLKEAKEITSQEWLELAMLLVVLQSIDEAGGIEAVTARVDAALKHGRQTKRYKNKMRALDAAIPW